MYMCCLSHVHIWISTYMHTCMHASIHPSIHIMHILYCIIHRIHKIGIPPACQMQVWPIPRRWTLLCRPTWSAAYRTWTRRRRRRPSCPGVTWSAVFSQREIGELMEHMGKNMENMGTYQKMEGTHGNIWKTYGNMWKKYGNAWGTSGKVIQLNGGVWIAMLDNTRAYLDEFTSGKHQTDMWAYLLVMYKQFAITNHPSFKLLATQACFGKVEYPC